VADPDLDRAIDAAVRQMMRVEPSAGVKARVFDRLGGREQRIFTWPRVAIIAAAVVVLAFVLMRLPRSVPATEMSHAPSVAVPVASSPDVPTEQREPTTPSAVIANRSRAIEYRIAGTRVDVPPLPPLEALEPLVVEPPRSRDIEPADIVIPAMAAIAEVQLEPLFPGAEQH
jgi:hypothetical protein